MGGGVHFEKCSNTNPQTAQISLIHISFSAEFENDLLDEPMLFDPFSRV